MKTQDKTLELDHLLDQISTMNVCGRRHVIKPVTEKRSNNDAPDYRGTGKALIGVLKPYETIIDFAVRYIKSRKRIEKIK